ncbi:hypothetical protein BKA62DRAFT_706502 [Auriculariales sp. MPI-PUGE-AT-0066]|nr:hypothetical protein BKA62DRAFT_706502 [Auriculariales sp. MPI-PUGE-AT-0066]
MQYLVFLSFTALVALIPHVAAHALVSSPPVRVPGQKHLAVCGQTSFDRLVKDPSGHIEEQEPVTSDACELTLCRGMLFEDQSSANIQRVSASQQMNLAVNCTIPHGGPANVTLLDTTGGGAGRILGGFLKTFDDFCPTSGGTPADQSNLQFTLPSATDIGTSCQQDGQCVVQLFWATPDLSQNYYYCVDVTVAAVVPPATSSSTTYSSTFSSSSLSSATPRISVYPSSSSSSSSEATQLPAVGAPGGSAYISRPSSVAWVSVAIAALIWLRLN